MVTCRERYCNVQALWWNTAQTLVKTKERKKKRAAYRGLEVDKGVPLLRDLLMGQPTHPVRHQISKYLTKKLRLHHFKIKRLFLFNSRQIETDWLIIRQLAQGEQILQWLRNKQVFFFCTQTNQCVTLPPVWAVTEASITNISLFHYRKCVVKLWQTSELLSWSMSEALRAECDREQSELWGVHGQLATALRYWLLT